MFLINFIEGGFAYLISSKRVLWKQSMENPDLNTEKKHLLSIDFLTTVLRLYNDHNKINC